MKTLFEAKVGNTYKILSVTNAADKSILRLCELGFAEGQSVKILARSILKHATLVEIRGYLLSVRTSLLKSVVVI